MNNKKNTNIRNKNETNKSHNKSKEIGAILPLIILVFFLPFVIRLIFIELEGPFYTYWTGERENADFFTYYKKIFLYVITVWTLLHTYFFANKIKKTKAYYFIGGFGILVVLSTVFSEYPQVALHGFNERHEGMWVVLCYLILIFSTINLINSEKQIKYIVYSLGLSGMIISVISIFQFFGLDIFEAKFMESIIIPRELLQEILEFKIEFGQGYSYGVFYNPNYLGGYMSFYSPLMLGYTIFSKDIKEKLLFGIFFILSVFALIFSRSEAGILGAVVASLFMIIVIYIKHSLEGKGKSEQKKILITRLVPILLSIIIIPLSISYMPINQNPLTRIRKEAVLLVTPNMEPINYKEAGPLNDIRQIDDHTIELLINNESTYIQVDEYNVYILNNEMERVWELDAREISEVKEYEIETITTNNDSILIEPMINEDIIPIRYSIRRERSGYLYFLSEGGNLEITNTLYRRLDIENDFGVAKYFGFEGKGTLGSGRGYIWSRSIPLMFENPIIGSGQDTFVSHFPQYDIFGAQKEISINWIWVIVDKPHNFYIQVGIHSGMISLILLAIGLGIIQIKGFKKYINFEDKIAITISTSVLGFQISSIFNDSIIAITPILMILIGILCFLTLDTKIKNKAVKDNG